MPTGRKAQYANWNNEDGLTIIRGLARDGFSDKQISEQIGISLSTFYDWKSKHSEFSDALKKGRTPVKYKVEDALYSRCQWKRVVEVNRHYQTDQDGNIISETIDVDEHVRWIPPDTTAIIFASKNLMPKKFRDKPLPPPDEAVEDDGLIKALNKTADDVFSDGDDSAMITGAEQP